MQDAENIKHKAIHPKFQSGMPGVVIGVRFNVIVHFSCQSSLRYSLYILVFTTHPARGCFYKKGLKSYFPPWKLSGR